MVWKFHVQWIFSIWDFVHLYCTEINSVEKSSMLRTCVKFLKQIFWAVKFKFRNELPSSIVFLSQELETLCPFWKQSCKFLKVYFHDWNIPYQSTVLQNRELCFFWEISTMQRSLKVQNKILQSNTSVWVFDNFCALSSQRNAVEKGLKSWCF